MADRKDFTIRLGTEGIEELKKNMQYVERFAKSFVTSMNKVLGQLGASMSTPANVKPEVTPSGQSSDSPKDLPPTDHQFKVQRENLKKLRQEYELTSIVGIYAFKTIANSLMNVFKSITSAGSELTELKSRFSVVMGEMTSEAEKFSRQFQSYFGINEITTKNNILKLYTLAQNAGFANTEALKLTKSMSILAAQLASTWDVDIETASDNLISALQGLPRAMKKYGAYLGTTEIKEFLIAKGIAQANTELTRGQKVLGVYLKSMEDLGYTVGDLERTYESVANQTRLLGETMKTIKQNAGEMVNDFIQPFLKIFGIVVKYFSNFLQTITRLPKGIRFVIGGFITLGIILPVVASLIMLTRSYINMMKFSLEKQAIAGNKAAASLLKYGGVLKTVTFFASMALLVIAAITSLISNHKKETKADTVAIDEQTDALKGQKRELAGFDDVNVFKDGESEGLTLSQDLQDLTTTLDETFGVFSDLKTMSDDLSIAILGIAGALIFVKAMAMITGSTFTKTLISPFGLIATAIGLIIAAVAKMITSWNELNTIQKVFGILLAAASAIMVVVAAILAFKGAKAAATIVGGIAALAAAGAAAAVFIPTTKKQIDSNMPAMAHGGVVSGPTVAMVGEGKYNEVVMPLGNSPEFSAMKQDITNAVLAGLSMQGGRSNQPINITVNVDKDYIYKSYNQVAKQNGR